MTSYFFDTLLESIKLCLWLEVVIFQPNRFFNADILAHDVVSDDFDDLFSAHSVVKLSAFFYLSSSTSFSASTLPKTTDIWQVLQFRSEHRVL